MSGEGEYCCYIGGLAFSTSERGLKDAFEKFGHLVNAKVVIDKLSGRSRGYGFVTFDEKRAMEEAIKAMHGMDLDGRNIIVEKAQTSASGRDQDGERSRDRGSYRDYGGGRGSNGGECFKCGKPGHFARECPSEGGGGSRYGGRDDRYGGKDDRYGGKDDRYGGRDDRYGGRDDRYGGVDGGRFGPDRNGDRSGGRSRDFGNRGGSGNDRYTRDRAGPYERRGSGSGNYR